MGLSGMGDLVLTCTDDQSRNRRFGLALDVDTATFFIGRETLVPAEKSELSAWRNRLYRVIAGTALSPARFYNLPTNRVVELGTQVSI